MRHIKLGCLKVLPLHSCSKDRTSFSSHHPSSMMQNMWPSIGRWIGSSLPSTHNQFAVTRKSCSPPFWRAKHSPFLPLQHLDLVCTSPNGQEGSFKNGTCFCLWIWRRQPLPPQYPSQNLFLFWSATTAAWFLGQLSGKASLDEYCSQVLSGRKYAPNFHVANGTVQLTCVDYWLVEQD